jgi:AcrR family transcriptional regulator
MQETMAKAAAKTLKTNEIPPRERILAAAGDLFYRHGIRAVGVDAIADAAGTNKMTLYRHFPSKDELVAEYLRCQAAEADAACDVFAQRHPNDPRAQLKNWLAEMAAHVAAADERGCPLANAAVELPDKKHPARCVIENFKLSQRKRLAALCRDAGLSDPDMLADELHLLIEGARVSAQSIGGEAIAARFRKMSEMAIASHCPESKPESKRAR